MRLLAHYKSAKDATFHAKITMAQPAENFSRPAKHPRSIIGQDDPGRDEPALEQIAADRCRDAVRVEVRCDLGQAEKTSAF